MRSIPEPDATDENQYRQPAEGPAIELASGEGQKPQRQSETYGNRNACGIVQGHEPAKSGRRGGSQGVEKRRAIRKGNSGQMRHEPVAVLEHFQGHAEAGCIVGLPWIVPEEPEPYPGNA